MKKMISMLAAITALLACSTNLTTFATIPAYAEEVNRSDYNYYLSLSDYEVYQEYCELYGYEASSSFPEEKNLPHYDFLKYYTSDSTYGVNFYIYCPDTLPADINEHPEMMGLPAEWYQNSETSKVQIAEIHKTSGIHTNSDGTNCDMYEITYNFENLSHIDEAYTASELYDSIADIYRIRLSLVHSTLISKYACYDEDDLGNAVELYYLDAPPVDTPIFGDINHDGKVDASDAACILMYAAETGAGTYTGSLEEYMSK